MSKRPFSSIGKPRSSSTRELWIDEEDERPIITTLHHGRSPPRRGLRERSPNRIQGGVSKGKPLRTSDPGKSVYAIQKEALCRELKTSNQIRRQLEEQLVNLRSEFRNKTEALKRSGPNQEAQLNAALAQCEELSSQLNSAMEDAHTRDKEIEQLAFALDEEHQQLESVSKELDSVKEERQHFEPRFELLKSELKDTRVELKEKVDEIARISDELASTQYQRSECIAQLDEFQQKFEANSVLLQKSQAQVQELNSQVDSMETTLSELTKTVADQKSYMSLQQDEFSNENSRQRREHEVIVEEMQRAFNEVKETASSRLREETRSHKETSKSLAEAGERIAELESIIRTTKRERDQLHLSSSEQVKLASQRFDELHAEMSEMKPKYKSLRDSFMKQQSDLKQLQAALDQAESRTKLHLEREQQQNDRIASLNEENRLFDSQRVELAGGLEREKQWREQVSAQLAQSESLCSKLRLMMEANAIESDKKTRDLLASIESLQRSSEAAKLEFALIKNDLEEANRKLDRAPAIDIVERARLDNSAKIGALQAELTANLELLKQERGTTRRLQNQVQELKGSIRIVARLRPDAARPVQESPTSAIFQSNVKLTTSEVLLTETEKTAHGADRIKSTRVQFDRVFGPDATNDAICEETEYLVQSALDGGQVCILAYGQTGSGKTYTMGGSNGVNTFALRNIMKVVKMAPANKYNVSVECVEIYNENLRDLLDPSASASASASLNTNSITSTQSVGGSRPTIQLNPATGLPELNGSTRIPISNEKAALEVLQRAMRHRMTAATQANQRSSRSHFVFSVHIDAVNTRGVLHLVDLAGSERLAQSKTEGNRLRETQAINTSLSSLGNVINALMNRRPSTHIPYRSSKLTYLLQGSLSGNAKTMLLTTLSPGQSYIEETKSTLRFAEKASRATLK